MVQFKCKMCGGTISVEEGKSTCQCEFCGTTQTVPSVIDNSKITVLHNRANSLRLKNEFDKALANYENIIIESPNDAEAHWGALLCRYGIEYVDDPKTGRKIPTCHRTQTKSIYDDIDYKAAIDNSDVIAKQLYQDEAQQINKIQKSILAVSVNEKPYDIFICYKESDECGNRTKDSVIAQELYEELTKKDYKVFFAKITLESKLGSQYEPYIFAALNSAKAMLVIGTKPEYFNAVWVKNEWARFLSIMNESNGKKYIIPCYRDMDAYDLPDELLSFQAQDMGKLGFIQDLTRGIDKLFNRNEEKKEAKVNESQYNSSINVGALLRRAEILLQSNNKVKANELLDEVLNNDPENAKAYALLAVIDFGFAKETDLEKSKSPLINNSNYNFAVQFADNNYKEVLKGYNDKVLECLLIQQNEKTYQDAINFKNSRKYEEAIKKFESIIDYKDARDRIDDCNKYIEQTKEKKYQQGLDFISNFMYDSALSTLNEIKGYKDSVELIAKVSDLSQYESAYKKALNYARSNTINNYNQAILILSDITAYRDSSSLIQKYKEKIEELKVKKERAKFVFKRFSIISAICIFLIIVGIVLTAKVFIPAHKYNEAMKYIESGNYESANALLLELNGYSDSVNQIEIVKAHQAFDENNYEKGIDYIYNIGGAVNVSYDGNDGEAEVENETIKKLSYITHKASRDGYTFYGWTVSKYEIYKNKGEYYCDLCLKSSWELITYSISYNLAGGNVTEELPKTYDITKPITLPNPTKKGYTFLGWKEARADSSVINYVMDDGTFGNKEYTAFWVANKYQISFELNGGKMSVDSLKVTFDSECTLPTPERAGYQFAGWYNKDVKVSDGIWKQDSDLNLRASWNILTYSISYNLNGGINDANNKVNYTIEDDLSIYAPHREGYTFIGWTINNDNNRVVELKIEKGTIGDIDCKANWQVNEYSLTYDVNGGDSIAQNTVEIEYGSNYELIIPSRTGYTFDGWYNNDELVNNGVWTFLTDINVKAHWSIITYTITYYLDGGEITNPATYNYDMDDITVNNPLKDGYTFMGWTNATIIEPQKDYIISKHSTGNIELYANWQANTNEIILINNGSQTVIYGNTDSYVSLPENETTINNKEFMGWSNNQNGDVSYFDRDLYNVGPNSSYTLYAIWTDYSDYTPVSTFEELQNMSLNGKYYLTNDIDCSDKVFTPIGGDLYNMYSFTGVLDGNGHTLYNFTSQARNPVYNNNIKPILGYNADNPYPTATGIFTLNCGTIKNLNISNVQYDYSNCYFRPTKEWSYNYTYGYMFAGSICGVNNGIIEGCNVTNSNIISIVYDYKNYIGLICGYNNGTISNSTVYDCSTLTGTTEYLYVQRNGNGHSIYGDIAYGSICSTSKGSIDNCNVYYDGVNNAICSWSDGSTKTLAFGAICGYSSSNITNCNVGSPFGGIEMYNGGSKKNNYDFYNDNGDCRIVYVYESRSYVQFGKGKQSLKILDCQFVNDECDFINWSSVNDEIVYNANDYYVFDSDENVIVLYANFS